MKIYIRSIIALLIGAVMLFSSCSNDVKKIARIEGDKIPFMSSYNVHRSQTDSAKVQGTLSAPEMHMYNYDLKNKYTEFPKGCKITRINPKTGELGSLTCGYGIHWENKNLYEAKVNVVINNGDGLILKTEQVFWDQKKHLFYNNDQFVTIIDEKNGSVNTGTGFESDDQLNDFTLKGHQGVTEFELKEEQKTK